MEDFIFSVLNYYSLPIPPAINYKGFTRWGKNNRYYMSILPDERNTGLYGIHLGDFVTGEHINAFNRKPLKKELKIIKQQIEQEHIKDQAINLHKIKKLWTIAELITNHQQHPYFAAKGVFACGRERVLPKTHKHPLSLVIPICSLSRKIQGLQLISDSKRFVHGSVIHGGFFPIGTPDPKHEIYVVEGYATGMSVHMATQKPVMVAFNAGNLPNVTRALFDAGYRDISIAADNDCHLEKNIGLEKAKLCLPMARKIFYPPDELAPEGRGVDFNDVHQSLGLAACLRML